MDNFETFLTTLKKGQIWMDSMLDMGTKGYGLGEPKKIAKETFKRKDFEQNAKQYLKDVPEISELIKPGMNDTKLKLKPKLSDIVLLGKEIIGKHKRDFDQTISNFKQEIKEISEEIEMLKEELSLTKLQEYEMKPGTKIPNKKAKCTDSAIIIHSKALSNPSYSKECSNITKDREGGLESLFLHDLKNSNWNVNIENPKYLSISENFISLDENIPRKCYWDRSQTSINLIRNLSRELKGDSLNNLLPNSERSIRNINNMIRNHSYSDSLIVRELFEELTKKKFHSRRCKEVEMHSESLEVEASKATIYSGVCGAKENENLKREYNRSASDFGFDNSSEIQSDYSEQKKIYTPTTITVQEVTDMLFSLSNILDKVPASLKHSKMADLNPPKSMRSAISMLAHLSKSIDIVQLSRSFSGDDMNETSDTNQNKCNLERKLGQYSMQLQ